MPNLTAYWVAPNGKSIDVGTNTHIKYVIDNPKTFKITKKYINDKYEKHGERVGIEGEARSEIMMDLMKKGWLRIRYLSKNDLWTIQTYNFSSREKNNVWDWIREALKKNWAGVYADIRIIIIKTSRIINSSFNELAKGKRIFERVINRKLKELQLEEINLKDIVIESSLSRIYRHNEKHDCGAITAFRVALDCGTGKLLSHNDNMKRNKVLVANLLKRYSVTRLIGQYPEGGKTTKENSFFVVDINDTGDLLKNLKLLGKKFDQDSVLFIPKGTVNDDDKAFLIGTNKCSNNFMNYGQKLPFEGGKFGRTSKIYTSYVNGRPFFFEEVDREMTRPGSGMGIWAMEIISEKDWKDIE